jgi:hypothetical protein
MYTKLGLDGSVGTGVGSEEGEAVITIGETVDAVGALLVLGGVVGEEGVVVWVLGASEGW